MLQVTYDLEERYGFKGYAATHKAPRPPTLWELAKEDEAKIKKTRQLAAQRPKHHEDGLRYNIADVIRRRESGN
jgi:hypothetical protein